MPRARRGRVRGVARALALLLLVPVVLLALAVGAWVLDTRDDGVVPLRNVEVAGLPVGGLTPVDLDAVLAQLATEYPATTATVTTPSGPLSASGAELGLTLDVAATRGEVLAVGRRGTVTERFTSWLGSFLAPREADLGVTLDPALVRTVVVERDPTAPVAPTEPGIEAVDGELVVTPGVDGVGLDPRAVALALATAAVDGELPLTVSAEPGPVPPRFTADDAQRLADRGAALTAEPLAVSAGDAAAAVPPSVQRTWLRAVPVPDGLQLEADVTAAAADLEALLADVGAEPVDASFRVEGDAVVIVPGRSGSRCCAPTAAERVVAAVFAPPAGPVDLPLTEAEPGRTTEEADALGIDRPVGSFTTRYPAGQSRVQNIHRISDLTRGVVIEPGGSFSVNDFIGRRTTENGFTLGGVIQDGVFEESVGGGISQFATTLFNAAFFGGLEFGAYQSHSIYISRYPYGREATLSFPEPDLVIENPTPHGVLIWPTYTPDSVTVTLWSTPWATGEQTAQSNRPAGACTRVTTERTRTFVADGRTERDEVYATYRPDEGVDC